MRKMYLSSNSKEDAYSQSPGPVDGWMLEFWERRPDGASECALGCYHALAWDLGDGEGTSGESGKCSAKFLVKYIHKCYLTVSVLNINVTLMTTESHRYLQYTNACLVI